LFATLAGIVWLMHFFAFLIYGLCVAGYECSVVFEKLRIGRRLRISLFKIPIRAAASLVVPLLAMLIRTPSNHGPTVWVRSWGSQTFWESFVEWKGEALASPLYFHHLSEKPLVLAILAIVIWGLATRTLVVNSRMLLPVAALGVIVMVMPSELFGWFGADYRLPSAVVFFAWASLGWGETSRARIKVMCLLLACCLIVRVGSVFLTWQRAQPIIEEYETAMRLVPPGSRLTFREDGSAWGYPPLVHVPVLAAAKQGVLVPGGLFADNEALRLLKERDPVPSSISGFDYLLEIGNPHVEIPTGFSLKEIGRGQTFALYRIERDTTK
jgi:hypothetical protein